jgi:aerobic-type carbon monoxide dehydrogenase small subunit (CoxS/CutS family)
MAADDRKKDGAKDHPTDPSRRRFLKGVGLVGAGAAIADRLAIEPGEAEAAAAGSASDGKSRVALQINGQKRQVAVEPRTTLLSAMRDHLEPAVTGPKLVCDHGTCGACTVMLDGKPVYSCLVLAVDVGNRKVTTAEGLGSPDRLSAVQQAFVQRDAMMCGFCTPGFVVSISAYLKQNPNPSLEQIRDACHGNFCRCGTYPKVFEAGLAAAKEQHALGGLIDKLTDGA